MTALASDVSNTNATAIQHVTYQWDQLGNLTQRDDYVNNLVETYGYDQLNRLTSIALNGRSENSFSYDLLGNMLSKADVGTYSYPPRGVRSAAWSILHRQHRRDHALHL